MAAASPSSGSGNKFSESSSSSSIKIRDLTDDNWSEICLHLPIKSVYKFKCISKVWLSFLSEPSFIKKWIQINTPFPWTLFYSTDENLISYAYPDLHSKLFSSHDGFSLKFLNPEHKKLLVLGSSNGLVLCSPNLEMTPYSCVCNPLTKKWVLLPQPPKEAHFCVTTFICDVLQTSVSYKVVRIPHFEGDSNKFDIEIFSSELGTWNVYQVLCPQMVTWGASIYSNAIIINRGILYWIEGKHKMITYNLGSGTCRLIDLPSIGNEHNFRYQTRNGLIISGIPNRCLGGSEGFIFVAQIDIRKNFSVWVLEEEKWHVLHRDTGLRGISREIELKLLSQNTPVPTNGFDARQIQVLGFSPVDRYVVILGFDNHVWAYNTRTGAYEELCYPFFLNTNNVPSHPNKPIRMHLPFPLKPMPTILPPPSWTDPTVAQVINMSYDLFRQ